MSRTSLDSRSLLLAVSAGLALAAAGCDKKGSDGAAPAPSVTGTDTVAQAAKACCKGLNSCKGKGDCAVPGKHECGGQNACKGQGGCNMHCPK